MLALRNRAQPAYPWRSNQSQAVATTPTHLTTFLPLLPRRYNLLTSRCVPLARHLHHLPRHLSPLDLMVRRIPSLRPLNHSASKALLPFPANNSRLRSHRSRFTQLSNLPPLQRLCLLQCTLARHFLGVIVVLVDVEPPFLLPLEQTVAPASRSSLAHCLILPRSFK